MVAVGRKRGKFPVYWFAAAVPYQNDMIDRLSLTMDVFGISVSYRTFVLLKSWNSQIYFLVFPEEWEIMAKDLRIQKTKQNIGAALLKLLKTKDPQHITVRDICQEAQCSRNTFYAHYYSKYALFEAICTEIVDELCRSFTYNDFDYKYVRENGFGTEIIFAAGKKRDVLTVLLHSDNGDKLQKELRDRLFHLEVDTSKKLFHWKEVPQEFFLAAQYHIGGVVNFLTSWLKDFPDMPVEEAAHLHAAENTQVANWMIEKFGN